VPKKDASDHGMIGINDTLFIAGNKPSSSKKLVQHSLPVVQQTRDQNRAVAHHSSSPTITANCSAPFTMSN